MRWLLLVLLVFVCAGCQTYYVSPTGNDSNPGTEQQPWRTIKASLQKLEPGSMLVVRGGTYDEQIGPVAVPDGTAENPIVVTAAGGERPVIRGYLQLLSPDYWVVNGVNVEYGPLSGGQQLVRVSGGTGWALQNMEISGAHSTAGLLIDDGSSDNRPLGRFVVRQNCIHDTVPTNGINQDHNVYVNDFNGSPDADGVIERNLLYDAPNGRNVKLGPGSPPEGGAHHVVVRYNTAYNAAQNLSTSLEPSAFRPLPLALLEHHASTLEGQPDPATTRSACAPRFRSSAGTSRSCRHVSVTVSSGNRPHLAHVSWPANTHCLGPHLHTFALVGMPTCCS